MLVKSVITESVGVDRVKFIVLRLSSVQAGIYMLNLETVDVMISAIKDEVIPLVDAY
jgi:hypothetical protein